MRFFVTGDTAWRDERKYVRIKRIVLTKPVSTAGSDANDTNSDKRAGEFKCATPARLGIHLPISFPKIKNAQRTTFAWSRTKTSQIGNSLAYLLSHKQ